MTRSPEGRRPLEDVDGAGLGRRVADEVDDELRFHVESRVEDLVARGMAPDRARARALREFGDLGGARRELETRTGRRRRRGARAAWLADLLRDARGALRAAAARPGLFAVAALSLGVGIAAASTAWTVTDRLVVRPLPYDPEGGLLFVGTRQAGRGQASSASSAGDFLELRARARSVRLAAYRDGGATLAGDPPEWVAVRRATPDLLGVLGVEPVLGRGFTDADAAPGAPSVVVLDHGLWERRFGGRRDALGRTVVLDGEPAAVVGVMPRGFAFSFRTPDVWTPLALEDDGVRGDRSVSMVGRAPGGDVDAARAELDALADAIRAGRPATHAERTFPSSRVVDEWYGGPTLQQGMGALVVAALLVLLVACANVANLLLARGADRAGEVALRRALGASRARVVRHLLTEAGLLALVGGALGVAASVVGVRALAALAPPDLPRAGELFVDGRAVFLGMVIAAGSTLLFGVLPSLRTLAAGERRRLAGGGRDTSGPGPGRLRSAFVAAEVALAVVLVTTTALVVRSVQGVRAMETGFDGEGVRTFRVALPRAEYPDDASLGGGVDALRETVAAVPGVETVGLSVGVPGRGWRSVSYLPPDAGDDPDARRTAIARIADPGYLEALGVEPLRGRSLVREDAEGSPPVVLLSRGLAERLWPDEDPLGRTLAVGGRTVTVVGVLPDLRELGPLAPASHAFYLPLGQRPSRDLSVVVRTGPGGVAPGALRAAVAAVPGGPAVRDDLSFQEAILSSAEPFTAMVKLLGAMAGAALLLAVMGVYAATGYAVARRVPEIGVRLALGAAPRQLRGMVLRRAAVVAAVGLAVGLPVAWAAGRALSSFVFRSAGSEPATFAGVAALLMAVSLAAAWAPARRASRVNPIRALWET